MKHIETPDITVAELTADTHLGQPIYRDDMNGWRVDGDGIIHLLKVHDGIDLVYHGKTITPVDNGYGRPSYQVDQTRFGTLEAAEREIDEAAKRPKVTWLKYRDFNCTKKEWPAGNITLHGFGREFGNFNDFRIFVEEHFGPDVVTPATENIAKPPYKWTEVDMDTVHVTPSQMGVIKRLAKDILEHDGLGMAHIARYEFKEFGLTAGHGGQLYLHTVVGSKDDEGTAAALVCRTYRHMVIGRCGGVRDIGGNNPRHRLSEGYNNVLIHGGRTR
jgi:hypothetical protein